LPLDIPKKSVSCILSMLNPIAHATAHLALKGLKNVFLIEPLEYLSFVNLMKKSYFIMTDSGGIQEEAASLGKPVLIIRQTTERPEIVEAGAAEIVGTDTTKIIERTVEILDNEILYERMSNVKNPYGDGKASSRIVSRLLKESRSIGLYSERKIESGQEGVGQKPFPVTRAPRWTSVYFVFLVFLVS